MLAVLLFLQATVSFPEEIRAKIMPFYEATVQSNDAWTACLFETGATYNKQNIPVTQVIDTAFGACKAQELVHDGRTRRMFQELGDDGTRARRVMAEAKATVRELLLSEYTNSRLIRGRKVD
jgi:hypothetical protein